MKIRRALPSDVKGIHEAHMRSIREVCIKDHTPAEVAAWGGREFDQAAGLQHLNDSVSWVVEDSDQIFGMAHLRLEKIEAVKKARIRALYLCPEALHQGIGNQIMIW